MASQHPDRDALRHRKPWGPSRDQDVHRARGILLNLRQRGWTQEEIAATP